jgi:hypothetical protein
MEWAQTPLYTSPPPKLDRYYNEELRKWVRPGEENDVRAAIATRPPTDAELQARNKSVYLP